MKKNNKWTRLHHPRRMLKAKFRSPSAAPLSSATAATAKHRGNRTSRWPCKHKHISRQLRTLGNAAKSHARGFKLAWTAAKRAPAARGGDASSARDDSSKPGKHQMSAGNRAMLARQRHAAPWPRMAAPALPSTSHRMSRPGTASKPPSLETESAPCRSRSSCPTSWARLRGRRSFKNSKLAQKVLPCTPFTPCTPSTSPPRDIWRLQTGCQDARDPMARLCLAQPRPRRAPQCDAAAAAATRTAGTQLVRLEAASLRPRARAISRARLDRDSNEHFPFRCVSIAPLCRARQCRAGSSMAGLRWLNGHIPKWIPDTVNWAQRKAHEHKESWAIMLVADMIHATIARGVRTACCVCACLCVCVLCVCLCVGVKPALPTAKVC